MGGREEAPPLSDAVADLRESGRVKLALVRAHLIALRTQLDALLLLVDGELGHGHEIELELGAGQALGTETRSGCPHPDGKQVNATTFGGPPMIHCLLCDTEYPGVLVTS